MALAHIPILQVAVLLATAFALPLIDRYKRELVFPVALFSTGLVFILNFLNFYHLSVEGPFSYYLGLWPPPWGIEFFANYLSVYIVFVLTSISLLVIIYASKDLHHDLKEEVIGWYYTLYSLLLGAMIGIAFTNDFFNMFVFIEIAAISACGIVSVKNDRRCIEASLKYLILSGLGSGCFLLAVAMIHMLTGHLNFRFVATAMPQAFENYPYNLVIILSLLIVSLTVKAALFPLHVWLPDAHSTAPSPSSAILSGLVIKVYAVAMVKIFTQVFPEQVFEAIPVLEIILLLSVLAMIFGSVFAMVQTDIKRMLAYSSVAQIGYVFLGIGLFGVQALTGGLIHIFNHAVMKSMLFLAAGLIIYAAGIRDLRDLKGIGMRMPLTMSAFAIGAFSMVGIPGTNGFISKWYLALGAIDLGRPIFVAVILLSSLLNGLYYFPIIIDAFFGAKIDRPTSEHTDVPLAMLVPMLILAGSVIFFGFYPGPLLDYIESAILQVL